MQQIIILIIMRKFSDVSEQTTVIQQRLVTEIENKPRQLLDSRKQLYDGIDFKPSLNVGITSHVFQLSEEQQICYISGNQYCLASSIDAQKMTFQYLACNSMINEKTIMLQIIKNKKISMVASLSVVNTSTSQINRINYFSRRDQAHRDISILAQGNPLSFTITSDGKTGFFLLDQSTGKVNKFVIYFLNIQRQSVMTKLDKPHKVIKTISSSIGDYNLILCPTIIYEVEIELTKSELVEFNVKQFLGENETYIEGGFVKSSFNLILITSEYNVLIFDHHKLVSKHELKELAIERPLITSLQAGISEIILELNNKRLAIFNLRNKVFEFGEYVQFLEEGEYKIMDFKTIRREIYVLVEKKKILSMWRISIRSKGQENLQLLSSNISLMDYTNPPTLEMATSPICLKQMMTLHSDGILRIWDLEKGFKGSKSFFQHVYCFSIHPLGHEFFAGFKEYGRIHTIAGYQFQTKYTIKTRGLVTCKYTLNGQYLLLQQNNTLFQLNAYSYETIRSISINLANTTKLNFLNDIFFISNDNYLVLHTLDGGKITEKKTTCYFLNDDYMILLEDKNLKIYDLPTLKVDSTINLESTLEEQEKVTVIKLIPLLGAIFISTSKGNIIQFIYPQERKEHFYKYKASESSIKYMFVHQTIENLTLITQKSIIINLEFVQLIGGEKSTAIYSVAKDQFYHKRSIMNREYMFQGFELQSKTLEVERSKEVMELQFYAENFTNDVEEKRFRVKQSMEDHLQKERDEGENDCNQIQFQLNQLKSEWDTKISEAKRIINLNKQNFEKQREELIDAYESKLLEIINKDKQLRKKKQDESIRLSNIMKDLSQKEQIIAANLFASRQAKYTELYNKLVDISKSLQSDREKSQMIVQEVKSEHKQLLSTLINQLQDELSVEEGKNRGLNLNFSKMKQEIHILALRGKQLENVIDEIEKQIKQLEDIKEQYDVKKGEMEGELENKQVIINEKEQEIKRIFSENRNKKNLKDIHEYLMSEYQKELEPGELKRNQLLGKVKMMNEQLIHENKWKIEIKKQVTEAEEKIKLLKEKKRELYHEKIDIENRLQGLSHSVQKTINKPPEDWMSEYKQLWEKLKPNNQEQLQQESEQKKIRSQKMISKAILNKQEAHRKIIESEKTALWQERHKENTYKKITNQNIELVKQHNLLQIQKKHLHEHIQLLKASIAIIEQNDGNILKRKSASLAVLTHKSSLKLTPFQKYTVEQDETKRRFSTLDKSNTKLKPIVNSTIWMKSVVNDIMKSKGDATQIMQRKISSFTNPEKSKLSKVISLHTPEQNSKHSNMMKIINNIGDNDYRITSARKP